MTGESSHIVSEDFMNRVLERIEELDSDWTLKLAKIMQDQEGNAKMEEFDELKDWCEYSKWKYTQLEEEFKEIGKARDQGLEKILELQ